MSNDIEPLLHSAKRDGLIVNWVETSPGFWRVWVYQDRVAYGFVAVEVRAFIAGMRAATRAAKRKTESSFAKEARPW